jgi:hypothetical protein
MGLFQPTTGLCFPLIIKGSGFRVMRSKRLGCRRQLSEFGVQALKPKA